MYRQNGVFTDAEWRILVAALSLTKRQQQIARCLSRGMTDLQVSKALGISVPTVRTHLARLFEKLDVDGRTGLILRLVWTFRQECRKLGCPRRR